MTKLLISKSTEAYVIATIWAMGIESLDPENYENLEAALRKLQSNRNVKWSEIDADLKILTGKGSDELK